MAFLLSLLFVIYILISAFLQARDNPLKDKITTANVTSQS